MVAALVFRRSRDPDTPVPAIASSGCPLSRSPGDYTETVDSGGATRSYLLHVPPRYDGSHPAPLVLAFHGLGLTADFFSGYTALTERTDQRNWIVAFPQAAGDQLAWNVFQDASRPDDATFARELLEHLKRTLCIDEARVYATGFSLGGGMAELLACIDPTGVAAAGVVAATFAGCTAPIPLLVVQGTLDASVPYLGGTYPTQIGGGPAPSTRDVVRRWASAAGCSGEARTEQVAADVIMTRLERCLGLGVVSYVVEGGAHGWPGSPLPIAAEYGGNTTNSISASDLIVDFFENSARR